MSSWLLPAVVEAVFSLLFCGVLLSLRKSLTVRGLAFWLFVWIARGAASLGAFGYLSAVKISALLYSPLQIAFALALIGVALQMEHQKQQLRRMRDEAERLRKESAGQLEIDPLTGLRNRSALTRWTEQEQGFRGLVVVCDMDDFKPLNDRFGHLVGDEILSGVGHLIRNSIRKEDLAFRWGGDEFVIFFRSEDAAMVEARMRELEERLASFQIRQHGPTAVHFSWGTAPTTGRALRECLEEADHVMYESKRSRRQPDPPGRASVGEV